MYGRRRVGKTYLIRETFNYDFAFHYSGAANTSTKKQLVKFRQALKKQGLLDVKALNNWITAFEELERLIDSVSEKKKVIFLDELPWMDAPRSGFLSELESFWNGWASARKDIVLVVCGSSTSWMIKKIIKNKGGLHNRLNHRIALKPFSLFLCEQLLISRDIIFSKKQIIEAYMIFGGIPYYWSLLNKGASLSQEIDRLIFSKDGELHDEYNMLYASLFNNPEPYIKVIEILAKKKCGLTRSQIIKEGNLYSSWRLSSILEDLEWCGFIKSYSMFGRVKNNSIYQLIDHFTLFYFAFLNQKRYPSNYWQSTENTTERNIWRGLAFERVCFWHIEQIKNKLGISGVLTQEYAFQSKANKEMGLQGVQIGLILDRKDGIIDLCKIKYSKGQYSITESYSKELYRKSKIFQEISNTQKAIQIVMITTDGLLSNAYSGEIQNEIVLEDLFR